ncbi:MAG: sensor histidine kinase, partial [Acutalibacteraceae bacterium]
IFERSKAMQNMCEELFRYSVILSQNELKHETVNLKTELENVLAANYTLLVENSITPEISLANAEEKMLDKNALSRILNNIISNAAKYSNGDLFVSLKEDGTIEIKNTAVNLDEVQVSKLFDRFYTVSNGRKSTGIGLSIAKHLTEQMGGKIEAYLKNNMLILTLNF